MMDEEYMTELLEINAKIVQLSAAAWKSQNKANSSDQVPSSTNVNSDDIVPSSSSLNTVDNAA